MAKQNVTEKNSSSSVEPHGFVRGLIDAIHDLVVMISSRLRHSQIHQSPMGEAKGEYDIWKRLGSHMEQVSAEGRQALGSHVKQMSAEGQQARESQPKRNGADAKANRIESPAATVREASELSDHGKRKAIDQLQPRMNEQLQNKTMEHINIALILAAEANRDGAKLHIDLAESAMHTASRFMSHEEYEAFKQRVEHRLESVIDGSGPGDSEN